MNAWIHDLIIVLQEYDTTDCGFAYSTADQVSYCPVQEPPIWPALLQLPEDQYTGAVSDSNATAEAGLNTSSASMLYTGRDKRTADNLMAAILARNQSIGTPCFGAHTSMPDMSRADMRVPTWFASMCHLIQCGGSLHTGTCTVTVLIPPVCISTLRKSVCA